MQYQIRAILLFLIVIFQSVIASEYQDPSRLIIGFHKADYLSLGGATGAADYINKQWNDKKPVSLVRPLGNAAILVEIQQQSTKEMNNLINKIIQLDKIKYINEDQPVSHFPSTDLGIPTLQ
ncbi:hypothetical protein ACH42_13235 [Endozoicomonas sp. (ex Bugula neritina AB1)]|nr:hypothetical protein ACH42_13235 [Endozoicomonas sp. (ex Bugula neritina AB1)]